MAVDYPEVQMYIDGGWTAGSGNRRQPIFNPATEQVLGEVPVAEITDLDRALAAAARGFAQWRDTAIETRTRILLQAARLLRERAATIGQIMTLEQGKPVTEARGEVARAAGIIQWDAEEARRAYGRIIPVDTQSQLIVLREPVGPVAAFTPWNFPAGSPTRKIAAALAAGCSIIIKASEEVPATACELVRCFADAGIPSGVLNLVYGVPEEISSHLIASPVIRFVAFTGSIPVGKHLAGLAARVMKPAVMELGGHAPVIVCDDVDPVVAARSCVSGKFINAGQVCTSPSRFIVDARIAEPFTAAFVEAASKLVVGNGLEPNVQMGPLANERRVQAVQQLVDEAVTQGARVRCGGQRPAGRGYFFQPTVLTDVGEQSGLMQIEPFGPVAPICAFTDLEDALRLANSLSYGLAAYAYTHSAARANLLMRRLEAGILSINHVGGSVVEAPSGGYKESGYGREGGSEGLEGYLVTKRVSHRF
ncbi:MAG: NAD-dependent succinate-semialdehyde dehydrogenase [Gammaproteobacteria bacterium]|nr:NAD-dependent succinate-semialdehyde dehydrogenase [Gammaproteobacteria bacterium]